MTTAIIETGTIAHTGELATSRWRTLPGRLITWLRSLLHRLNTVQPHIELHDRYREEQQSRYEYFIHRM